VDFSVLVHEANHAGFGGAKACSYAQEKLKEANNTSLRQPKLSDKEIEENFWRDIGFPKDSRWWQWGVSSPSHQKNLRC
jgi:hypothetical protein